MNEAKQLFEKRLARFGRVRRGVANATLAYWVGVGALGVGSAALILLCGWTSNPIVNGVFVLAAAAALVWLLVRLLRGWEKRRSVLSESFRAEALAGDLNSRIISAVDFLERSNLTPLTEVVIRQAQQDLKRPFEKLLDRAVRNRLRLRFALLLVAFLLLGATPWFSFARLGNTVARCATEMREALFPTRYELFPGAKICRLGTEVEAGLRFTRFRYPEVTMLAETPAREGVERTVLRVDAAGRAAVKLNPTVEKEYRIRFAFGKRTTDAMKLVFTTSPMIENMQVELVYPVYTRLVPKETEGIVDRITALAGTRVNLGFVFSKPLKSAVLTFDDKTRIPLDVVGRFASVSFVHSIERGATLQVEDIHEFVLEKPHAIEFGLTVDKPPKLFVPSFLKPDMPYTLDELAGFTFGARVEDDFGAAKCVVKWSKSTTEKPDEVKVKGEPIERVFLPPRPTAVAAFENLFREQAQSAEGGDKFTFQVEAFDNRDPKPQSAMSSMFSIFIRGQGGEGGVAGGVTDIFGGVGPTGGRPPRPPPPKPPGSQSITMPSKIDTTESYKSTFTTDRSDAARPEALGGAIKGISGHYGSAVGGAGSGAK
jgi:hypothetical protein